MSELKVNKVTPRSGTTVTIGDSGEHLALAGNIGLGGATPTDFWIWNNFSSNSISINRCKYIR
jgi:hypothetical protein